MSDLKDKLVAASIEAQDNLRQWFTTTDQEHMIAAAELLSSGTWPIGYPPMGHQSHPLDLMVVASTLATRYVEDNVLNPEFASWAALSKRFKSLGEITGRSKLSSYDMHVSFDNDGNIFVELGCYDISEWPRTVTLGPFPAEAERDAIFKTYQKILEAEDAVANDDSGPDDPFA